MMIQQEFVLVRDCKATMVPSGEEVTLSKGSAVIVTQALGGALTVKDVMGVYRLRHQDLDALGNDAIETFADEGDALKIDASVPFSEEKVWSALTHCYDPEIPLNIVDLGLIYDLNIQQLPSGKYTVEVKMTLTTPSCGMGPAIAADACEKIERLHEVESAKASIVWDPPWNPMMISPEGRKKMGM